MLLHCGEGLTGLTGAFRRSTTSNFRREWFLVRFRAHAIGAVLAARFTGTIFLLNLELFPDAGDQHLLGVCSHGFPCPPSHSLQTPASSSTQCDPALIYFGQYPPTFARQWHLIYRHFILTVECSSAHSVGRDYPHHREVVRTHLNYCFVRIFTRNTYFNEVAFLEI